MERMVSQHMHQNGMLKLARPTFLDLQGELGLLGLQRRVALLQHAPTHQVCGVCDHHTREKGR